MMNDIIENLPGTIIPALSVILILVDIQSHHQNSYRTICNLQLSAGL